MLLHEWVTRQGNIVSSCLNKTKDKNKEKQTKASTLDNKFLSEQSNQIGFS